MRVQMYRGAWKALLLVFLVGLLMTMALPATAASSSSEGGTIRTNTTPVHPTPVYNTQQILARPGTTTTSTSTTTTFPIP